MKRRYRRGFSPEEKTELWDRWQRGESLKAIGRVFGKPSSSIRCALRPGNVHSAHGWHDVLEPVVARYRDWKVRRYFRDDAAFASPDLYEFLEAEGYKYAIRLKANAVLQASIAHLLTRPVGRPPNHVRRFHASFSYQAASWNRKRRVVARLNGIPGNWFPGSASSSPT